MKKVIWGSWALISIVIAAYLANSMFVSEDKSDFLIGETSHGHFQIELACEACHSDPFGGPEVLQDACVNCHAQELEDAHDSHPKKKFTDPREAFRLEIIDARYCVSCHTEHQEEQTHAMGVTLPDDYCYHCHKEISDERESHKDLPFDSCASAGCHNFHDNRALYESFLIENADQPWLKEIARIAEININDSQVKTGITLETSQYQEQIAQHPDISQHWQASSHAQAGVDCGGCHYDATSENPQQWIAAPSLSQCETCHKDEVKGFTSGKHGMRLANSLKQPLKAITPAQSQLAFHDDALNIQHSCNACHGAHEFNTKPAAAESCLNCHADEHSTAFNDSPHGKLWQQEISGEINAGEGVSCATCHMPRVTENRGGEQVVRVEHNQNLNLRPNEKMIRQVCMNCHGLEFAIDALADPKLINNNFNGKPGTHIESVDWAKKRDK